MGNRTSEAVPQTRQDVVKTLRSWSPSPPQDDTASLIESSISLAIGQNLTHLQHVLGIEDSSAPHAGESKSKFFRDAVALSARCSHSERFAPLASLFAFRLRLRRAEEISSYRTGLLATALKRSMLWHSRPFASIRGFPPQ